MFGGSKVSLSSNQKISQDVVSQSDASSVRESAARVDDVSKRLEETSSAFKIQVQLAQAQQRLELMYARKKRELEDAEFALFDCAEGPHREEALQRIALIKDALEQLAHCLLEDSSDPESRIRRIEYLLRTVPFPPILKAFKAQPKAQLLNLEALCEDDIYELDSKAVLVPGAERYDIHVHKNTQENEAITHPCKFEEERKLASHIRKVSFGEKRTYSESDGSESIAPLSLTAEALEREIASCERAIGQKEKAMLIIAREHVEIEKELDGLEEKEKEIKSLFEEKNKQLEELRAYYGLLEFTIKEIESANELDQALVVLNQERQRRKNEVSRIRKECSEPENSITNQNELPHPEKLEEKNKELICRNDELRAIVGIYSELEKRQDRQAATALCKSELKNAAKRVQESEAELHQMSELAQQMSAQQDTLWGREAELHQQFDRMQRNVTFIMKPKLDSLRDERDEKAINSIGFFKVCPDLENQSKILELDQKIEIYKERLMDAKEIYSHRLDALKELKEKDVVLAQEVEKLEWYLCQAELGINFDPVRQEEATAKSIEELKDQHRKLRMDKYRSEDKIAWLSSLVDMQRLAICRVKEKVEALQRQIEKL